MRQTSGWHGKNMARSPSMIYGSRVCTSKIIVVLPILGFAYWVSTCAGRV